MKETTQTQGKIARATTLLITYAIKLVGLASAFNQLLLQSNPRALPLAIAAFMMAGAQLSEGVVLAVIDRLISAGLADPPERETTKPTAKRK